MDINTVTEIIKNVDPTQTTKYIGATVGGKMLYDDLASPTIKAAGELGAKIFKALTVNCDIWAENRIKLAHRLQDDIANELKGKSPADITENPPEYILYPAIMQYMHSIDRDELRKMYAKLISKALLENVKDSIHPAFVNILQNLHPNEAHLLNYFSRRSEIPIVNTKWVEPDTPGYHLRLINIYTYPYEIEDIQLGPNVTQTAYKDIQMGDPAYISNLSRLGIITVSFLESFTDKSMYNEIENLPIINENKEQCLQANRNFEIEKGICRLTPFGKLLISTCIK